MAAACAADDWPTDADGMVSGFFLSWQPTSAAAPSPPATTTINARFMDDAPSPKGSRSIRSIADNTEQACARDEGSARARLRRGRLRPNMRVIQIPPDPLARLSL